MGDDGALWRHWQVMWTVRLEKWVQRENDGGTNSQGLYTFPGVSPAAADGCAINLWNNLWSVNYVFWYPFAPADASFGYRFALRFEGSA